MDAGIELAALADRADLVIAADGGAEHCAAAGVVPDVVMGDFDSISSSLLKKLEGGGKKIIPYPAEKDFTDLELALKYAVDNGGKEIVVLGALGARWDMSVANLMLLGADFLQHAVVRLVVENQEAVLLRGGHEITVHGNIGDLFSLIPLGRNAHGVTTEGLRYPLDNETLFFTATRGVSNQLCSANATIALDAGLLLCIHERIAGECL